MKNYTNHADGMSSVNSEQIENNSGKQYRASGNLLIIRQTNKVLPKSYIGSSGVITGFSANSGVRMRRYLRECQVTYKFMVTLTYPCGFSSDGKESKEHLRRFLQEVRREHDRRWPEKIHEHSSFWFLEFQERGAPHYHIFLTWTPPKEWVSIRWYNIVGSEDIRHFRAGTRVEQLRSGRNGTIKYASKYAAKLEQKKVPTGYENVGRFWGVYGRRVTVSAATFVSRTDSLREEVAKAENNLIMVALKAISDGEAEVIKRDDGIVLISFHASYDMRMIRLRVSMIEYQVKSNSDIFLDAEIMYG